MNTATYRRHRGLLCVVLVLVVALGLATRRYGSALPTPLSLYGGDTLWAAAVFVSLALLRPAARRWQLAVGAALFSLAVELSQLAHPAWLETLRGWPAAGLLIGYGFVWSDLACYALGIVLALVVDWLGGTRRGGPYAPGRHALRSSRQG